MWAGFEWVKDKGQTKWATFKYERLSDFCYGCGRLGHTSQHFQEEIVIDGKKKPGSPLYGPWIQGIRPTNNNRWHNIGGGLKQRPPIRGT